MRATRTELMMRFVPNEDESLAKRHSRIVEILRDIGPPLGLNGDEQPLPPDFGTELIAECRLDPQLAVGVRGSIVYRYRRGLREASMYDDYLRLLLQPNRIDFRRATVEDFPRLIEKLEPYLAYIGPESLALADFDILRRFDSRRALHRFYPATFVSAELSKKALRLSPGELVSQLESTCEVARQVGEGALLIFSSSAVDLDFANKINEKIWRELGRSIPG